MHLNEFRADLLGAAVGGSFMPTLSDLGGIGEGLLLDGPDLTLVGSWFGFTTPVPGVRRSRLRSAARN